jgi:hypothetical protein
MRTIVAALVLLGCAAPLTAQTAPADRFTWWASLGFGGGRFGGSDHNPDRAGGAGIIHLGVTGQVGHLVLSARGTNITQILGDDAWDVGLLAGLATKPGRFHGSVSAGIGAVGGQRVSQAFNGPTVTLSQKVSLPLAAQVSWRPTKVFGLGLYGSAAVASGQHIWGVGLSVILGDLR